MGKLYAGICRGTEQRLNSILFLMEQEAARRNEYTNYSHSDARQPEHPLFGQQRQRTNDQRNL